MRGASRMMPSVAENENNRETSPAQNGFNKLMVRTATARELSGSAWRPDVYKRQGEYMEFEAPLPPYSTDFVKTLHAEDE